MSKMNCAPTYCFRSATQEKQDTAFHLYPLKNVAFISAMHFKKIWEGANAPSHADAIP